MSGILLDYQNKWINDDASVRVYEKSRRIGISWSTAADAALVSAAQSGMNVWYIGYNKDMAEEFIRDCASWIQHYQLVADEVEEEVMRDGDKDILTFVIRCASGYRITALSSRPNNLRGKQGYVIIDEAAFHDQLGELIKAAIALLMWGGKVAVISTHDGVDNPFNQLCEEIKAGKKPYSLHRTTFDQACEQNLYKRICKVRGIKWTKNKEQQWMQDMYSQYGDDADEELRVIPSKSGGSVLSRALLLLRSEDVPIIRLTKKDSWAEYPEHLRRAEINDWGEQELLPLLESLNPKNEHVFGMDFARSGDLSALAPLSIEQDTRKRTPFLVELKNIPHAQQVQIIFYICDRLPRLTAAWFDATGNGEYTAEAAKDKYGSIVNQVKLNNYWYNEHMPAFVAAFEDNDITIPKDSDVIDDHRSLQKIDGIIKLPKGKTDKTKTRHGDTAIALALAYSASRDDSNIIATAKAGKRRLTNQLTEGY